jgi:hypothetical protein
MSSARWPEHGGATALGVPAAPHAEAEFDSQLAALPEAPLAAHPPHLVPCAECAALNGRSAQVCWSCEADLLALRPRPAVVPPRADTVVPVVHELVVAERDGVADGRRGLHLVSRTGEPASVLPVLEPGEPAVEVELPVLTFEVQGPPMPPTASASVEPRPPLRLPPPMVALALAAVVLVVVAASLRWHAPSPAASPALTTTAARPDAAFDRPFATPSAGDVPDTLRLSFPAVEVAPDTAIPDRAERVPARSKAGASAARPPGRAREGRSVVAPAVRTRATAPAPCTSNMAALGFCTLEPATAKE